MLEESETVCLSSTLFFNLYSNNIGCNIDKTAIVIQMITPIMHPIRKQYHRFILFFGTKNFSFPAGRFCYSTDGSSAICFAKFRDFFISSYAASRLTTIPNSFNFSHELSNIS